jgi:hypothetical protein
MNGPCKICGEQGSPILLNGKAEYLCKDCAGKIISGSLDYVPELEAIIEVQDGPEDRQRERKDAA